ncbi:hypothetical protein [Lentzea aerocolonigenes]|nr:hypothetical protein [Lentzea aerocolonigenes]
MSDSASRLHAFDLGEVHGRPSSPHDEEDLRGRREKSPMPVR